LFTGGAAGTSGAFRNDLLTPDVRFRASSATISCRGFTTGIPATKGLLSWGATTTPIPRCSGGTGVPGRRVTMHSHAPPAPLTRCHQLGLVFLIPHLLLLHVAAGEEKPHHPVEELVGELDSERDHVHLEGRERHTR
uniref:Uncharacterized protein n=1 Tax=Anas zonorhyncha TaxID=75864 RepID=A0A8B9UH69_9AVES